MYDYSWWTHEFLLVFLAVLCLSCSCFFTNTPTFFVILAISMLIGGILGWIFSKELHLLSPWLLRLISTVLIGLGIALFVWYFRTGRTVLHPLFDIEAFFKTVNENLSATPGPSK